jgi:hypothetical protein
MPQIVAAGLCFINPYAAAGNALTSTYVDGGAPMARRIRWHTGCKVEGALYP